MGEQEAKVKFSEQGSQQVIGAFRNVGSAAGQASTSVGSAGSAIGKFQTGAKSAAAGIGQMATAFATLTLSIVGTYRAYRDLTDAQIQVDAANKKVHATELAIKNTQTALAAEQKKAAKGGLDYAIATNKITQMEQKLKEDRKSGKKSAAELKGEELAILKARNDLKSTNPKVAALEEKLTVLKEGLGVATLRAGEAQEHFNDVQQNFYLSLLPTAISGIATLTTGFSGLKGVLGGGGGGILGMLGPLGIGIGALSLGIIAYQNNWLGLKDAVGGVITWIQDRVGLWKQGFQDVFSLIQKGDWAGAFNRIKEGAQKFWADLVNTVPFFKFVDTVIGQIKNGNWLGAFNTIKTAAIAFWNELKAKIPFFGGVETFIKQLAAGNWSGAFATIQAGLTSALGAIGGEKLILKFQLAKDSAISIFNLMAHELTAKGGAFDLIQTGLGKIAKGDVMGGVGDIATGVQKAVNQVKSAINAWVLTNFGIDLGKLESQALAIGNTILTKIKDGLTFVARTWIDPIIASLFKVETWTAALTAVWNTISAIGQAIFTFLAGAIGGAASDPKGAASFWTNIGSAIWNGIVTWMEANLPDTTAAMKEFALGFVDAIKSTTRYFELGGMQVWNSFIDGIKAGLVEMAANINPFTGLAFKAMGIDAEKLKNDPNFKKMWTFDIDAKIKEFNAQDAIEAAKRAAEKAKVNLPVGVNMFDLAAGIDTAKKKVTSTAAPKLPIGGDNAQLNAILNGSLKTIASKKPVVTIDGNAKPAETTATNLKTKIDSTTAKLPISGDAAKLEAIKKSSIAGITGSKPKMTIDANPKPAETVANNLKKKIDNMTATIRVNAQVGASAGFKAGVHIKAQHGMHVDKLKKDTMILAHKNEYVHIDKPGKQPKQRVDLRSNSSNVTKSGSGGGSPSIVNVRVYLGNEELKDFVHQVTYEGMSAQK